MDNQAAIKIVENVGVTARNKHFTDVIHYFRHCVDHRSVKTIYVDTLSQRADGFTKALDKTTSRKWTDVVVDTHGRKFLAKSVMRRRHRYRVA